MGVRGLYKILRNKFPECLQQMQFSQIANTKQALVAVDASICMYQVLATMGPIYTNRNSGDTSAHIVGFMSRAIKLMELGMKPVFVFDGPSPLMKCHVGEKRNKRRERTIHLMEDAIKSDNIDRAMQLQQRLVKPSVEQFEQVQSMLQLMGVPVVQAPSEAEATCAILAKNGVVAAAASDDSDSLAFGSPTTYRFLHKSATQHVKEEECIRNMPPLKSGRVPAEVDSLIRVDLDMVLEKLDINFDQFVDFCIICGTDYVEGIQGVGPLRGLALIKQHENIETILEGSKYSAPCENWQYKEARTMFKNSQEHQPTEIPSLIFQPPKMKSLNDLLLDFTVSDKRIDHYLGRITKLAS